MSRIKNLPFCILDVRKNFAIISIQTEQLNSKPAPVLRKVLDQIEEQEPAIDRMIFDLSSVKWMDSSGLCVILHANSIWKQKGSFILSGLNYPSVKRDLEVCKIDSIVRVIPKLEEAILFFEVKLE